MYVSNGNIKVKSLIFNLPCKATCKKGLSCRKFCYSQKAEKQYPQVLPCRLNNLKASKRLDFVDKMISKLKRKKNNIVRIHESGDWFSQKYIAKWFYIATQLPNKTFYAYTKRDDLLDDELLSLRPSNLKLIWSVDSIVDESEIKDIKIPKGYDSVAIVTAKTTNCPAQLDKSVKCMKECKKCLLDGQTIIFSKH